MKLIIVRHSETTDNSTGTLMGHKGGELSGAGIEQAKKLGLRFKNEKIDFIYSSDLRRTKDTVAEIIKHHPRVPVIYDQSLREQSLGVFEGMPKKEALLIIDQSGLGIHRYRPEGGENRIDLKRRVRKFIKYLTDKHKESDTILICTHGGWKHAFLSYVWQLSPASRAINSFDFNNAAVTIFELESDGNHVARLINCTKHLG